MEPQLPAVPAHMPLFSFHGQAGADSVQHLPIYWRPSPRPTVTRPPVGGADDVGRQPESCHRLRISFHRSALQLTAPSMVYALISIT